VSHDFNIIFYISSPSTAASFLTVCTVLCVCMQLLADWLPGPRNRPTSLLVFGTQEDTFALLIS
jgi:hypothetical protein